MLSHIHQWIQSQNRQNEYSLNRKFLSHIKTILSVHNTNGLQFDIFLCLCALDFYIIIEFDSTQFIVLIGFVLLCLALILMYLSHHLLNNSIWTGPNEFTVAFNFDSSFLLILLSLLIHFGQKSVRQIQWLYPGCLCIWQLLNWIELNWIKGEKCSIALMNCAYATDCMAFLNAYNRVTILIEPSNFIYESQCKQSWLVDCDYRKE